jgi:glycosyltransferase involved in cell wall biosynthesis
MILFVECVASLLLPLGRDVTRPAGISVVVLVPAHNEEEGIGPAVAGAQSQLAPGDRVLVVADNCTHDTAQLARAAGAEVIERSDRERRGKGYALAFGVDHLEPNPPDVVLVLGFASLLVLLGGPAFPAWIAGIALALVALGVAAGWARYGRKTIPFRYLLLVPLYMIWKVPLYAAFVFGRRERQWRRTER